MHFYLPYAGHIVQFDIDDMGFLPSGRKWLHIMHVCPPEIGKRVANNFDSAVITQWVDDGHPSGDPMICWTALPAPSAEDDKFIKAEIERRTGSNIIDDTPASSLAAINKAARKRARKATMMRRHTEVA